MTYDISGSGFDDATSDMQLQLGGEREERCIIWWDIHAKRSVPALAKLVLQPGIAHVAALPGLYSARGAT